MSMVRNTLARSVGISCCRYGSEHAGSRAAKKKPNIVVLMADIGALGGGVTLGHPTPNIDRLAKEGALFSNWYGQASCTAGRASFQTGRIPIRSALSDVVVPGDRNGLLKETPTIACRAGECSSTADTSSTSARNVFIAGPVCQPQPISGRRSDRRNRETPFRNAICSGRPNHDHSAIGGAECSSTRRIDVSQLCRPLFARHR